MNKALESKLSQLNDQLKKLETQLSNISDTLVNQPQVDRWSLGQVLHHMYLAERLALSYMQKKVQDTSGLRATGIKTAWRMILLKVALFLPLKFKAPRIMEDNLADTIDKDQLFTKWWGLRDELMLLIKQLPKDKYQHALFKHPRIGYINIYQTLEFFHSHFNHHLAQVADRLKAKQEPITHHKA